MQDILSKLEARPLIVRTNYGDESIALTQWLSESEYSAKVPSIQVVYIDTGWAASSWQERVLSGEEHAKSCGFTVVHIKSPITFPEAVLGRGHFPSSKFTWCTGLLKGLPLLDWLDSKTVDLEGKAIIVLAKRRAATHFHHNLESWIERCQYHGDRSVWHAVLEISNEERDALLVRAGFTPLHHRSLECQPCVNSSSHDLGGLSKADRQKIQVLESAVGQVFDLRNALMAKDAKANSTNIKNTKGVKNNTTKTQNTIASIQLIDDEKKPQKNYLDLFYRGCGNHFGCGL